MKASMDTILNNCIQAIKFIHAVDSFSVPELQKHLNMKWKQSAYRMFDHLSRHYSIYEVSPYKGAGCGNGSTAARFSLLSE